VSATSHFIAGASVLEYIPVCVGESTLFLNFFSMVIDIFRQLQKHSQKYQKMDGFSVYYCARCTHIGFLGILKIAIFRILHISFLRQILPFVG